MVILPDYVSLGRLIFNLASEGDFVVDLRRRFDEESARQMEDFLYIVSRTQSVPELMRKCIETHRRDSDLWIQACDGV